MNDIKKFVGVTLSILAIVIALIAFFRTPQTPQIVVQTPKQENTQYGSVSGPDIASPYFSVGGVRNWLNRTELARNSTSTLFSYLVPFATTTLRTATCRIQNNSGATQTFQLGLSSVSNTNSTTTLLAQNTIANGNWGELVATTTSLTDSVVTRSMASSTNPYSSELFRYINMKVASGTPGTLTTAFVGDCSVDVREL